jgi:hypothetical protein
LAETLFSQNLGLQNAKLPGPEGIVIGELFVGVIDRGARAG